MIKPLEEAVFSLKIGEVSGIVETQYGYHIVKVEDKRESSVEPFDTAKEKINKKMIQDLMISKINEFIEKAMKDAKAEMYPEKLIGTKN
jgi:parvulin-like peptidyl-prolyl isomerase